MRHDVTANAGSAMTTSIILELEQRVDEFLVKWTRNMDQAGYLQSTTAKREDCVLSYQWFLTPLWQALRRGGGLPDFHALLRDDEGRAGKLLATARRHRFRGVTAEMFIGCFKTMVMAIEEMILDRPVPAGNKLEAVGVVRRWADAVETRLVGDWTTLSQREAQDRLDESNRSLTLEKNKYENILAVISDLVLLVDENGAILELNRAATGYFPIEDVQSRPIWQVLGMGCLETGCVCMDDLLRLYPQDQTHEVASALHDHVFELRIVPLKRVSLASSSHLMVLRDITHHVRHRDILARTVEQRTADLHLEKQRLEEMNITLRTVLQSIDSEMNKHRDDVARTVDAVLLPALERARAERPGPAREACLDILRDQLHSLGSGAPAATNPLLLKLTPTEMTVCQHIQAGSSTKEIAEALNLSEDTVQTHRKNIRKKLNIRNKRVNLQSFLRRSEADDLRRTG